VALLREAGVESGIRISPYHAYAIAAIEGQRYKIDIVADGGPIFEATTEEPDPDTKAIAMHYCDLGGFFFTRRNNSIKALEYFELAVTIDPDSAKAWTNLGVIYKDLARYEEVVPAYIRALELEPTFYMAFENLLKVMQWGEEAIKAAIVENLSRIIELAERGSSHAPDNPGILFCLGNFYCAQGNFTKGIETFDASLRLNPNQTEVKTCRARALTTLAEIKKESDAP
jgi:tetratricopeptide (TPR) repeat protein